MTSAVWEMLFEIAYTVVVPRDNYALITHSSPLGFDMQIANRHCSEMLTVLVVRHRKAEDLQQHEALERAALTLMRAAADLEKGGDGSIPMEKPVRSTVHQLALAYADRLVPPWINAAERSHCMDAFEAGYATAMNRRAELG